MTLDTEQAARGWVEALPHYDKAAGDRLDRLIALLGDENERQNLVSAASLGSVWQRHIADSAQLLNHVPRETSGPWLDLGTGAGFPGLVIAALLPEMEVVMVESRTRRIEWLERVCRELGLTKARVEGMRLEMVSSFEASVISARAFAALDKLVPLAARFSTSDTQWVLPKGRSARQELDGFKAWQHVFHVEQSLTDPEAGIVVGHLLRRDPAKKPRKKDLVL